MGNGECESEQEVFTNVPVLFGDIVSRMKVLVLESVQCNLIISNPSQIKARMMIDKYNSTVKLRDNGKIEMLDSDYKEVLVKIVIMPSCLPVMWKKILLSIPI